MSSWVVLSHPVCCFNCWSWILISSRVISDCSHFSITSEHWARAQLNSSASLWLAACQPITSTPTTIYHTTPYLLLLQYLGKFKSSNLLQIRKKCTTKRIDFYMHPFNVTHLLTYCLLTYYFSFWFLLNILWKSILLYAKRSSVNSALHTGHATLYD